VQCVTFKMPCWRKKGDWGSWDMC